MPVTPVNGPLLLQHLHGTQQCLAQPPVCPHVIHPRPALGIRTPCVDTLG